MGTERMAPPDILRTIMEAKQAELEVLRRAGLPEFRSRARDAPPPRDFLAPIRAAAKDTSRPPALIAEVKKASPSKGVIREDFHPARIAEQYAEGGASCLSVLTDREFFQGGLAYLQQARDAAHLPVLRKDFTLDRIQLYEARAAQADAILLIAACLDPHHLLDLRLEAEEELRLAVLVEIHDIAEWEALLSAGPAPGLVGVNNRNLRDFTVELETTEELAPAVLGQGALLVAESGIFTPADVARLRHAGASSILVGESLMRENDIARATRELLSQDGRTPAHEP